MWVIDIRCWLDEDLTEPATPRHRSEVEGLCRAIAYATARCAGLSIDYKPTCWRKANLKSCNGELETKVSAEKDQLYWKCTKCGYEGMVTGWKGLIWDMTDSKE